jgi:transcription elongation factor Elf1
MDRATLLAALTRNTPCPSCGQRRLEFLLRCDLQFGACLCTAHCRACNDSFEIAAGAVPPDADVLQDAVDPCPGCGGRRRRAALHCSLDTHACAYTLECVACAP